jgi:molecular chaperone Hsp33
MEEGVSFELGGGSWITHALGADGAVRVVIAEADEVADALRQAHGLGPRATALAAECTVAAFMLSAYAKGDERLTLQIALEDPAMRYLGEVDPTHRFRGRLSPSDVASDFDPEVLTGLLFAAKHDGTREVYRGVTPIAQTSIAGALRGYLRDSAQLHGVFLSAVELSEDGKVTLARGALIERLPPHDDYPSLEPEAFRRRFGGLETGDVGRVLRDMGQGMLQAEKLHILEHKPVFWGCSCSRERVIDTLAGLSPDEILAMAEDDGGASVDCHFCNAHYDITEGELRALLPQDPAK